MLKRILVPRPLLEADVVIACPKLKTHFLDPVTGAIKLWVGAVRQDTMHRLHRDRVQETVADLLSVTRPDLVVMDAIVAGEGNGPVAVRGRFVGCVLASDDPVALDVVAGDLAGFDGAAMAFPARRRRGASASPIAAGSTCWACRWPRGSSGSTPGRPGPAGSGATRCASWSARA